MRSNRFKFGKNWSKYASLVDEIRIKKAELHLQSRFNLSILNGNLLDIGSGSGVFTAAASRLGARVKAFDYDLECVATTQVVAKTFGVIDKIDLIKQGDILGDEWLGAIKNADFIYSWGVLHHTGSLWQSLANIADNAKPKCIFVTAIYNDLGEETLRWTRLKKLYVNRVLMRPILVVYSWYSFWAKQQFRSLVTGKNPLKSWIEYSIDSRGMSAWHDLVDWAGGYPFEASTPTRMIEFMAAKGWRCEEVWRNNGIGNNEFRFIKL